LSAIPRETDFDPQTIHRPPRGYTFVAIAASPLMRKRFLPIRTLADDSYHHSYSV
jgi:hypothetical protein